MARGTQLIQLAQMVREECGRASSLGVGNDDLEAIKTKLRRAQELYYDKYAWPHLHKVFDVETLLAGERYYDPPLGLNVDRIDENGVVVWYSGIAHAIPRGIVFSDYNMYAAGTRAEPVLKWDVRATGNDEVQIEVWPTPSTNNQKLQFSGIRNLNPLVADSDRADLDDQLLVLTIAAEMLAARDEEAARAIGAAAKDRVKVLVGNSHNNMPRVRMGMGSEDINPREIVIRVGA